MKKHFTTLGLAICLLACTSNPNVSVAVDSLYFQADPNFSTSHDFKVARFMANDLLQLYIRKQVDGCKKHIAIQPNAKPNLQWTGSKVHFIELAYALHSSGMINNGNTELKTVITFFSEMFEIDPGQFHRTFLELRSRKYDRTKFLSLLATQLTQRMDNADEN